MMNVIFKRYKDYQHSGIRWLGSAPKNWKIMMVKNVYRQFGSGSTPLSSEPKYYNDGEVNWLNTTDLRNTIVTETKNKISKWALAELSMRVYPKNTLAIAMYGQGDTRGSVGLLAIESTTNQAACMMYGSKNSIPKFMLWWFVSQKTNIRKINVGTTQPNMNQDFVRNLFIAIPSLEEQQVIADYLDAKTAQIDRKIDLLEQKAEKYAELKQSLINDTVTRGLDKTVAMKDSGVEWIGQIPAHWQVYRIKDFSYVKGRIGWQGLRNSDFLDQGNYYCITGTDLVNGSVDWSNCYFVSQERYDQDKFIQLKLKDLLITKDGTIGKIALVSQLPLHATLNSGVFVTRPLRNKYINEFMYWVLNSSLFKGFIDLTKGGSTIQHLYQNVFDRFLYCCPPLSEQKNIAVYLDKKTSEIDAIIEKINAQVENFKELRKTLINDVVTGKIKVYEG